MAELPAKLPPKLHAAEWTRREDLALLTAALGPENVRWVGGAVRDTLLRADVHDIDAATVRRPDEVVTLLEKAAIRSVPTGIAHGTVTALLDSGKVEITTLRHDVTTDGRHADVAYAGDWREDAARRDFTINALYAHPETLEIEDYFGGIADLQARRVRFIGDPRERIREDHLRILRYFRFYARFGGEVDHASEDACAELASMLKGLSRERVGWELINLLKLPDPADTVARMEQRGVLAVVLPEAGPPGVERLRALIAAEHAQDVAPDPVRRLAALVPPDTAAAEQVSARLRLSTSRRKRLVTAAGRAGPSEAPRALAYRLGREEAVDQLLLSGREVAEISEWEIPTLPLKGGEIVARGVGAGPEVARILQAVERRWVEEGFPDAGRIEQLLQEVLGK